MPINTAFLDELEKETPARDYIAPPKPSIPKQKATGINYDFIDSLEADEHPEVVENKAKIIQPKPTFPSGTPRDIRPSKAQPLEPLRAAKQIVPQLVGGTEEMVGTVGSAVQWTAEQAKIGNILTKHINIPGSGILAEFLVRKFGPKKPIAFFDKQMTKYAKQGEKWADFWEEQANKGWEAPDPEVMQAKWREKPVVKGAATISRAAPNYLAAIALTALTKSPQAGLLFISGVSGAGAYRRQRKAGTGKQMAHAVASLTAGWEYITEKVPFEEVFKPSKHLLLKMLKIGTLEAAQEFVQGIGENFLEHFGYTAKDLDSVPDAAKEGLQHTLDGWIDNVVAGFGLGIIGAGAVGHRGFGPRVPTEASVTEPIRPTEPTQITPTAPPVETKETLKGVTTPKAPEAPEIEAEKHPAKFMRPTKEQPTPEGELQPTFDVYGNYILNASKRDLKQLRSNKAAKGLWPVIDKLRPEIKGKKKAAPLPKAKPEAVALAKETVEGAAEEMEGIRRANPVLFRTALKAKNANEFINKMSKGKPETVSVEILTDFYNKIKRLEKGAEYDSQKEKGLVRGEPQGEEPRGPVQVEEGGREPTERGRIFQKQGVVAKLPEGVKIGDTFRSAGQDWKVIGLRKTTGGDVGVAVETPKGKRVIWNPEALKIEMGKAEKLTKKKGRPKGFLSVKPLEIAHRTVLKILEPTKLAEKAVRKGAVAEVIKAIHAPEAQRLGFREQQLESVDKTFGQLRDELSKYPDDVLDGVMLTRGHKLEGKARQLQIKAFATLPKELKEAKIRRALDEIADFNYKYLQRVVGDDVTKMQDYFYGIYKSPKLIRQFLKYWKTTKRFTKHKVFPTYADAKAYGLEIRNPNPVDNLMAEYSAIAHLDSMNWLKSELMRLGEGKFIAKTEDAPIEWSAIGEGLPIEPTFSDVRIQPDLARVINNLISTNKITKIPVLNTIRQINNVLRTIKFIGSAFHLMSVAKQSVADSGYLGFYKPTAYKGITSGFRKDDPIFKTPEYRDYIQHGGGHRYSVESESQRAFSNMVNRLTRSEKAILKVGGTPIKIPLTFVNWMFKNYIPKVKYAKYLDTVAEKERKLERPLKSAEKIDIIKEQQNFYGMMNERLFGRSGTFTTLLRFIFMAPGYAEGNYRTILKAGLQKGSHRSRSNIINSWLITGTLATVGTLILTGKWPEKPEDLDDIRDLFKIDTGKKDQRDQRIMIDLMTYDKDYWNVYFNIARLKPDKALSLSVRRIGGMRAPSADFMIDLLKLWRGEALIDWKGDEIYYLTDPFLLKIIKTAKLEVQRLIPISASVFKQSRQREIDKTTAAVEMLLGLRPTRTERDKREFEIVRDIWSLRDQREKLAYRLNKYDDPIAAVRKYNETVKDIIDSKFVRERAPDLIAKGETLFIDEEKVKLWVRYPVKKMSTPELKQAIEANTYKRRYKRDGKWYPRGHAHKGKDDRVKELRVELAGR